MGRSLARALRAPRLHMEAPTEATSVSEGGGESGSEKQRQAQKPR